jgi:hypothetical protein
MAQRLSTAFVNTNIPGAYVETTVKSTPVGLSSTGDIVIIGEAEGGADYTEEVLKDNFFTATQLDRVKAKYLRGPIVDAMAALVSPSNDSAITGSANRVYIVKTNGGSKASATIAGVSGDYGTMSDKNYGKDGNKYYYQISQVEDEVGPRLQGADLTIGDGSIFNGLSFTIRGNGGAETVITLSAISGDHDTIGKLAAEINGQMPTGFSCEAASGSDALVFKADEDAAANEKGYGKSFELIDSTAGDLAASGVSPGLTVSSQEPEIQLEVKRQDTNTNESFSVEASVALSIGYQGSSASLDISSGTLTTTVIGGSGSNLTIDLSEYPTMSDLAAYISSQPGYSATSAADSNNLSPIRLDEVSAVSIASTEEVEPGRVKKSAYNFARKISESSVVDFEFAVGAGLPVETAGSVYLTGGAKGGTTAADIVNAIPSLEGIKVNFVLPLFSRDYTEDIADGLTDSSSTYTIDAINFAIKSHVLAMSTVKLKRNRIAMLSKYGTYAEVKTHAQTLSSYRATVCFQKSSQTDSTGEIVEHMPWHTAAIAAGMQSAGFYKSLVNKGANVISFKDPSGFDSGNPGDVEDAIDAGLMFLQQETAGNSWVIDQTTYGFDGNFVYNALQAVYMSDVLAIQLADQLQKFIVGRSTADINAAAIEGQIAKIMEAFRKSKVIGASDDAPLGYKNVNIAISAPIAEVKLEAKLATAILFVPIQLELSQIQSSTSA